MICTGMDIYSLIGLYNSFIIEIYQPMLSDAFIYILENELDNSG